MINIGIIGVGRWGINYFRTLNELGKAKIKWICTTKKASIVRALDIAKPKNHPQLTTNYRNIFRDKDVDAVIIATPGITHYNLTKDALKSGKHVLVEKPIAFSSKDAKDLIRISEKGRRILMVGHIHLYNHAIRKLKEDISAGLFGKINYIQLAGTGNGPIREDMTALWDIFPHDVSILFYLLKQYPLRISANGACYIREGIADVVSIDIFYPKNIFATSFISWIYPLKRRDIIISGEKLYAVFDDYAPQDKLKYYHASLNINKNMNRYNSYYAPVLKSTRPLAEELLHFLDCIENGKPPLTDGYEALKVTRVLEAAQKSLKNNGAMVEI